MQTAFICSVHCPAARPAPCTLCDADVSQPSCDLMSQPCCSPKQALVKTFASDTKVIRGQPCELLFCVASPSLSLWTSAKQQRSTDSRSHLLSSSCRCLLRVPSADCDCYAGGTEGNACRKDPRVGMCVCKPNFQGTHCDQCTPGHYGPLCQRE